MKFDALCGPRCSIDACRMFLVILPRWVYGCVEFVCKGDAALFLQIGLQEAVPVCCLISKRRQQFIGNSRPNNLTTERFRHSYHKHTPWTVRPRGLCWKSGGTLADVARKHESKTRKEDTFRIERQIFFFQRYLKTRQLVLSMSVYSPGRLRRTCLPDLEGHVGGRSGHPIDSG